MNDQPKLRHDDEPTFTDWYAAYPKKQGKAAARKRWAKMTHDERVAAWAALPGWQQYAAVCGTQYVPMASTWLNQARWEDDAPEIPRQAGPGMTAVRAGMQRARAKTAIDMINRSNRKELNP